MSDWVIRPAVLDDEPCLASMWLKSYAHSREIRELGLASANVDGHADEVRYWKIHQPVVTALLRGGTVRVACDPERATYARGPAVIIGWACVTPGRIHWVGVKREFMAQADVARELVTELLGEMLASERLEATFDLMDLRRLRIEGHWRRDRSMLAGLRSLSLRRLDRDALFLQLAEHILQRKRPEWREESAT